MPHETSLRDAPIRLGVAGGHTVPLRRAPVQARAKERIQRILDAAEEVFVEVGYDKATTNMIACRAKTSVGSIYYLATLLARPAQQVHALELTGERPAVVEAGDERRLRDLQTEIDEARAQHDLGRLDRAEDEFDDVLARLQAASSTPQAERARQSVTRAIKRTIDRIAAAQPELGEHLRITVRTGVYSSYRTDSRTPITRDT